MSQFHEEDCRWAVYDFEFQTKEMPPRNVNKIIFFHWVGSKTKLKDKMVYSTALAALKSILTGVAKDV